jgi:hypothetical protein
MQPPSLCFLAAVGFYVVVCGEVEAVLVFDLVVVAEASVQLERCRLLLGGPLHSLIIYRRLKMSFLHMSFTCC